MTDTELTLSERIQRLGNPGISSHDVVAEDDVYTVRTIKRLCIAAAWQDGRRR